MKLHLTQIAAAAGLVLAAGAAFADPIGANVPVSTYTTGTTDIYLAGSSAVDLALTKFIANSCVAGTMDSYRTDAGGKTYYLWTCTPSFALSSGNTLLAIHKNTNSSSDGTNAVATNAPLAFLQVSDLQSVTNQCGAPTTFASTTNIPTYNYFVCGTNAGAAGVGTLTTVAHFGFSDSEPAQFASPLANTTKLTTAYPFTVLFGVPVSVNLRNALQSAQGLTSGDESEAGMPTISSAQIASAFTSSTTPTVSSIFGVTVPGTDGNLYRVRRSNGSGTTRAFDATFIGDFCVASNGAIAAGTTLVTSTIATQCATGAPVLQAGTSDDMASCLSAFNTNAQAAIGYLLTDYLPGVSDGYRWVKVDGYSPKALNVVNGKWKFWSEESINYNTAAAYGTAGDTASFYNQVKNTSINNALLAELVSGLTQTTSGGWTGAILAARSGGKNKAGWGVAPTATVLADTRTDAIILANPQNPLTHQTTSAYSLCAPAKSAASYQAD